MIPQAILARALPYLATAAVTFGAGWSAAWYAQGLRLTAAKQDLVTYQQSMVKAVQAARDHEYSLNVEAQNAWAQNMDRLRATWRTGWVPVVPDGTGSGFRLPPVTGVDDPCKQSMELARRLAQELAQITLLLNSLQERIEAQDGY